MKATQRDFANLAPRAAQTMRVFFLCGTDDASVQDAAFRIASLLPDAGERVELTGAELKRDPVRLGDEARSTSLFGDTRHIWVRCSGDEVYDAVENLIGGDVAPCPVIIQAANASDKARTAKLLEKREDALVAMFYPPDLASVTASVRQMADAAGAPMDRELAQRIAAAVGSIPVWQRPKLPNWRSIWMPRPSGRARPRWRPLRRWEPKPKRMALPHW